MRDVLEQTLRRFISSEHLRNVLQGEWVPMYDDDGIELKGIRGRVGVAARGVDGHRIGLDMMELEPGRAFPSHTHSGDHILYILDGEGEADVNGETHPLKAGDTIFVAAEQPHSFRASPSGVQPLRLLAVGHPHKHLSAIDRLRKIRLHKSSGSDVR